MIDILQAMVIVAVFIIGVTVALAAMFRAGEALDTWASKTPARNSIYVVATSALGIIAAVVTLVFLIELALTYTS